MPPWSSSCLRQLLSLQGGPDEPTCSGTTSRDLSGRDCFERRLVREDLPAVVVEPSLRVGVARPPFRDEPPEARAVVQLDEVADLVHDDVVEDVVRGEDEPPVEAERPLAGARTPAAALIAQRDPAVRDAERSGLRLRDQRDTG